MVTQGIDPPRLDLFLAKAYDLLDTTVTGIRNNRELISDIAVNTAGLLKGLNEALKDNRSRVDRIVQNVEALTADGRISIQTIADSGHFLPMERPELCREALRTALEA